MTGDGPAVPTDEVRQVRGWVRVLVAGVALLAGGIAAVVLLVAFTVVDDSCPAFESEGPMAAPDSPYSQVMCDGAVVLEPIPMEQISLPPALLVSTAVAVVGAAMVVWRRPRSRPRRFLAGGAIGVLVLQPLLIVTLQYALPRDCLSGPTAAGECSRDRELR